MLLKGHVDEISRRRVAGWAADMEKLTEPVTVSVIVNGRERGRLKADVFRPNLKENLGGDANGHHAFHFEFEPPLSRFEQQRIEVKLADNDQHIPNGNKLLPKPTQAEMPLLPVVLTSVGRSGSTLMMSELARHPEIVTGDTYPYEIKLIAYYSAAFDVLVATQDRTNSTDPLTMFSAANRAKIGHNPYNSPAYYAGAKKERVSEFFLRQIPDEFSNLFHRFIVKYYNILRQEQQKHAACFFAEKGEIDEVARQGARLLFGEVREIVVVRDPRDLMCSAAAFWNLSRPEAFQMLQTTLPRLATIHQAGGSDTCFVRYEDLIRDPAKTWRRIYNFIDVEADIAGGEGSADLFKLHGTSDNPAKSIGRWRQDLDPTDVDNCQATFASWMRRFGYNGAGAADEWEQEPRAAIAVAPRGGCRDALVAVQMTAETGNATLPLQELMLKFESLGENCEFGLVQRHCGAEPVGLLRFASSPLSKLLPALDTRFEGVDNPEGLQVELSANGREYMVDDAKFGFHYHAWVLAGEMQPEDVRQREMKQLPVLVRKLIDDLAAGEKIFVYHGMNPLRKAAAMSLAAALRTYGSGTLLWVELADPEHPPGTVYWVGDDVIKAHLDRFAPEEDAHNISLAYWIAICRESYRLWRERREARPDPAIEQASASPEASTPAAPEPNTAAPQPRPEPVPTGDPSDAPPEPELERHELLKQFESLGENCEFGLVQRRCGAEPLGLFRFASAPLSALFAALEGRFEGFGAPENVSVELSSNGREYMVRDGQYGFLYHAWVMADEMRPEEIREREARRLPLLIRKLVEDLTDARKLLVIRGMGQPLEQEQVERLLAAVRRYGPNVLLWVELADAGNLPGSVAWAGPDLLKGYIDRFAPGEDAHDLSLDCWVAICREAERLWRRRREQSDGGAGSPAAAAAE